MTEQNNKLHTDGGEVSEQRKTSRRQLLKAGLIGAAPLIMTVRARPVWAQEINPMSNLGSPWYRGPWNERGDVLKDGWSGDPLDDDNILKYRDADDAPQDSDKPTGGSSEWIDNTDPDKGYIDRETP